VAIEIEVVERMAAGVARNQLEATQDERAHEDLAQLGVGLHDGQQLCAPQLHDFAGLTDSQSCDRRPAGDQAPLAGEGARTMADDQVLCSPAAPAASRDSARERRPAARKRSRSAFRSRMSAKESFPRSVFKRWTIVQRTTSRAGSGYGSGFSRTA
jgi:hypothetical protein